MNDQPGNLNWREHDGERDRAARRLCIAVIPIHNEAENLPALSQRLTAVARGLVGWNLQALLVDDGSEDASVARVNALRDGGAPLGLLQLSRNFGHQAALCAGLEAAVGLEADAVVTMDGDLQHPPEQIPRMLESFDAGHDVVQMVRADAAGGSKGMLSQSFYKAFNSLSQTKIIPNGADFRLIGRNVLEALIRIPEREKFLRGLIPFLGFCQTVLEFDEAKRLHGKASFSIRRSAKMALTAMLDFSTLPLQLVFWAGLSLAVLSFCVGSGHVIWKLMHPDRVVSGFTDIISAVFFLDGCILAALGVVGRYLMTVLDQVRGRPTFVVQSHLRGAPLLTAEPKDGDPSRAVASPSKTSTGN